MNLIPPLKKRKDHQNEVGIGAYVIVNANEKMQKQKKRKGLNRKKCILILVVAI